MTNQSGDKLKRFSMFQGFLSLLYTKMTYCKLVLTNNGLPPKKAGTASSIILWLLTKLRLDSGSVEVSTEHLPGRGFGSLIFVTGSQFEFAVSLK